MGTPEDPGSDPGSGPVAWQPEDAGPQSLAQAVLAGVEARLLGTSGVTSVGIGAGPGGGEVIVVGVTEAGVGGRLPAEVQGVPLVVEVTGPVEALRPR